MKESSDFVRWTYSKSIRFGPQSQRLWVVIFGSHCKFVRTLRYSKSPGMTPYVYHRAGLSQLLVQIHIFEDSYVILLLFCSKKNTQKHLSTIVFKKNMNAQTKCRTHTDLEVDKCMLGYHMLPCYHRNCSNAP